MEKIIEGPNNKNRTGGPGSRSCTSDGPGRPDPERFSASGYQLTNQEPCPPAAMHYIPQDSVTSQCTHAQAHAHVDDDDDGDGIADGGEGWYIDYLVYRIKFDSRGGGGGGGGRIGSIAVALSSTIQ